MKLRYSIFAILAINANLLASRKDDWGHILKVFNHIGYIWAFISMIMRFRFFDEKINLKIITFPFASAQMKMENK